jgi:hypothetical protein
MGPGDADCWELRRGGDASFTRKHRLDDHVKLVVFLGAMGRDRLEDKG